MVRKYWLTFEDLEIPDRVFGSPPDMGYFRFNQCIRAMTIPELIVEGEIASWCGREIVGYMASSWVEMGYPRSYHQEKLAIADGDPMDVDDGDGMEVCDDEAQVKLNRQLPQVPPHWSEC